jgi:hypothetical protein
MVEAEQPYRRRCAGGVQGLREHTDVRHVRHELVDRAGRNSPPPPAGPLPAFMAVIVSSSIGRSGSTLSGNTVHMVILQTNAGYAPSPGHTGTGTVVAEIC